MKIETVDDLRRHFPDLIREIEDEVLEKLGIFDEDNKRILEENEKQRIRKKARTLAGM